MRLGTLGRSGETDGINLENYGIRIPGAGDPSEAGIVRRIIMKLTAIKVTALAAMIWTLAGEAGADD